MANDVLILRTLLSEEEIRFVRMYERSRAGVGLIDKPFKDLTVHDCKVLFLAIRLPVTIPRNDFIFVFVLKELVSRIDPAIHQPIFD